MPHKDTEFSFTTKGAADERGQQKSLDQEAFLWEVPSRGWPHRSCLTLSSLVPPGRGFCWPSGAPGQGVAWPIGAETVDFMV